MKFFSSLLIAFLVVGSHALKHKQPALPPQHNLASLIRPQNSGYQVHLSLGEIPGTYVVTWLTPNTVAKPLMYLQAGSGGKVVSILAATDIFIDNGTLRHTQYVHRATTSVLAPGLDAMYRVTVSDNGTTTNTFTFRTVNPQATSASFTVYGDFGLQNPVSYTTLQAETQSHRSDVIIHTGDFAYDMYQNNATWGDRWFNYVEPVYSAQPVMVCPGNHEGMYNFLNYRKRFSMPMRTTTENLYYSFDFGPVHWISYSTEVYFQYDGTTPGHGGVNRMFGPYPHTAKRQLEFIEADLQLAVSRRSQVPWIAVYGHRPMYCSDNDDDDCVYQRNQWKTGLEDLFYKYKVDFVFEAHQHTYERLFPVYNGTVMNGTQGTYINPPAPVHIVAGAAGCVEDLQTFGPPLGPWSAIRIAAYGIGHLDVKNSTHAYWEQIAAPNRTIVDSIWVIKDPQPPN
eukprot:PhF_6_TR31479/c0_g1_i2/m.46268